jgi:hypothetical protein
VAAPHSSDPRAVSRSVRACLAQTWLADHQGSGLPVQIMDIDRSAEHLPGMVMAPPLIGKLSRAALQQHDRFVAALGVWSTPIWRRRSGLAA